MSQRITITFERDECKVQGMTYQSAPTNVSTMHCSAATSHCVAATSECAATTSECAAATSRCAAATSDCAAATSDCAAATCGVYSRYYIPDMWVSIILW